MKKLSLLCVCTLACLGLTACGSNSTHHHSESAKAHSEKVAKAHRQKAVKKRRENKQAAEKAKQKKEEQQQADGSNSSSQSGQQTNGNRQVDKSDPSTWHDIPYKGYPSYDAYCQANGGDPEVQA